MLRPWWSFYLLDDGKLLLMHDYFRIVQDHKLSKFWRMETQLRNGPVLSIVIYSPQNASQDQDGDSHFDWDFAYPEV